MTTPSAISPSSQERGPWAFQEAAPHLNVSVRHLIRLADQNKVKTIRLGRRRLIPDAEVRRLAMEGIGN